MLDSKGKRDAATHGVASPDRALDAQFPRDGREIVNDPGEGDTRRVGGRPRAAMAGKIDGDDPAARRELGDQVLPGASTAGEPVQEHQRPSSAVLIDVISACHRVQSQAWAGTSTAT